MDLYSQQEPTSLSSARDRYMLGRLPRITDGPVGMP